MIVVLKHKFSQAAGSYDAHAHLQKEIAGELVRSIGDVGVVKNILDIGTVTGYLISLCEKRFPGVKIFALDFAYGMLEQARRCNPGNYYLQAQAENLPFNSESFDLIVSGAVYQWVKDLKSAFGDVRGALKRNGKFYFSVFSQGSLKELYELLLEIVPLQEKVSFRSFPVKEEVEASLAEAGFKKITIRKITKVECCDDTLDLLKWLKGIGANYYWHVRIFSGLGARGVIERLDKLYKQKYSKNGKICVTFEVLLVEAE